MLYLFYILYNSLDPLIVGADFSALDTLPTVLFQYTHLPSMGWINKKAYLSFGLKLTVAPIQGDKQRW